MATKVAKSVFGTLPDGREVPLFTLQNETGFKFSVSAFGAAIVSLHCPSKKDGVSDMALGFDDLSDYVKRMPYFGVTVGRVANRIAMGKFSLDGAEFKLAQNNGPNHAISKTFIRKKLWISEPNDDCVTFRYTSEDGEEGYPGQLDVSVTFSMTQENGIRIQYKAKSDKPTPVNLSNHSYFNLGGHASGSVLDHDVQIFASSYTPVDDTLIPTGQIADVKGTAFDFTQPRTIKSSFPQNGFDHNFVLSVPTHAMTGTLQLVAKVFHSETGRTMTIFSTQPGLQFYTGNFLDGTKIGKGGCAYHKHNGFCMETQNFPDAINHDAFPSSVLRPGKEYAHETVYQFSW